MTNLLVFVVIFTLLFGKEEYNKIGRTALTIIVGLGIIGRFLSYPICVELFSTTNLLLLIVIYILLFGANRFIEKSKISVFIVFCIIVIFVIISFVIDIPQNIAEGNWKDILIGGICFVGSFIIAYLINKLRKK